MNLTHYIFTSWKNYNTLFLFGLVIYTFDGKYLKFIAKYDFTLMIKRSSATFETKYMSSFPFKSLFFYLRDVSFHYTFVQL